MSNPIAANPNATAATVAGSLATVLVYFQGVVGLDVPAEVAAAEATLVIGGVLWLGRVTGRRKKK